MTDGLAGAGLEYLDRLAQTSDNPVLLRAVAGVLVAKVRAAPEPEELVVERVAGALRPFLPAVMHSNRRNEMALEAAHAAITAMEPPR